MLHVAFINRDFPAGGVARVTLELAGYLRDKGIPIRLTVLTDRITQSLLPPDMPTLADVVATRHPVEEAILRKADVLVQCSRMEKDIRKAREAGIKVVFADHGKPFHEQYAIIDRRMGGRRRLPWKRFLWNLFLKKVYLDGGKARRLAVERTRKAFQEADAFVALCESYRQEYLRAFAPADPEKVVAIPNPTPTVEHPTLEKEKMILYCGRLSDYDKKVDRLLRIWAAVQDSLPEYRLEIVGDGHERARLEDLSKELKLKNIRFEGNRRDVDTFYRRADLLCLTSQFEGWGLCLTEAQSHGVIPLSFNCCAGVEEVLSPSGENGFLIPPGDEKAFAKKLLETARLPEAEKRRLRENCLRKATTYSPEKSGALWVSLFQKLKPDFHP